MIGFINVNKPSGMSSGAVVSKIRKLANIKRVGHMGTLDPLACGVLPIAIGKATRMFDYFLDKEKSYSAIFEFGYETDTLDREGKTTATTSVLPTIEQILAILPKMVGEVDQMPPQYSAKSVDGVRAYKLARKGIEVELKPKRVTIHEIKVYSNDEKSFRFDIRCSSGTYIRSICRDIARAVNSLATMTYLQRTESGGFTIDDAINLEDLTLKNVKNNILPIEKMFTKFESREVEEDEFLRLKNGLSITMQSGKNGKIFIKNRGILLGVADVKEGQAKMVTNLMED